MMRICWLRPSISLTSYQGLSPRRISLIAGGRGAAAAQRNAGAELLFLFRGELPVDFDQVGFRNVALRGGDGVGEFAIVGEQDQAVAVIIEPPDGVDTRFHAGQQIEHGGAALRIAGGADHAVGLIQRDVNVMRRAGG